MMRTYIFIFLLFFAALFSVSAQENLENNTGASNMKVSNPGTPMNSAFADFNPVVSADESIMVFSSGRTDLKANTSNNENRADIYITRKKNGEYEKPEKISSNINSNSDNLVAGLSPDGTQLFICKNDNGNKNLYISTAKGNIWSKPVKMGTNINSASDETTATLSADGNSLFFSSNRPGGSGGFDIYISKKLPNGEWGEAQNIGQVVNTKSDETSPYIHSDGYTLFFSSKGLQGMGGFDIFFTSQNEDNTWNEPLNFGAPVNTTEDDIFYTPTAEGKRAWYCATQKDGIGSTDIYMIAATNTTKALSAISGFVKLENTENAENTEITLTDNESKEMIGKYIPNPKNGKFLIIISPRKSHVLLCEAPGFFPSITNLSVARKTSYQESETVVNIDTLWLRKNYQFYQFDFLDADSAVSPKAETKLETLTEYLKSSAAQIEIAGNKSKLSSQRVQYLKNYLKKSGISETRLNEKFISSDTKNKIEIIIFNKNFENDIENLMKTKNFLRHK